MSHFIKKRRCALAVVLACLAPLDSNASDAAHRLRTVVDAAVHPIMSHHDIPGMSVALAVDGESHVFHYGVSSRQSQAPVTDSTIFEIGSVSKLFTATLAARAQATGHLSLSDHPGRYIPRLKGRHIDRATLLNLGTYTAGGLPLQFPDSVRDDEQALSYFQNWQPDALPGTARTYSNPSVGLLGAVTAAALKDRFASLIEAHFLSGFGMRHTFIRVPPQEMTNYAWGHRDGKLVRVNPGPMDEPTYGIKSTASDMIRFVQANIDSGGLDVPWRLAIQATQVGHFRVGDMVQGFGWEQFPYPISREQLLAGNSEKIIFQTNPVQAVAAQLPGADRLFDKTGSTGGFGAYVVFVPTRRIGLVMLANRNVPIPARIAAAHAILEQLATRPR